MTDLRHVRLGDLLGQARAATVLRNAIGRDRVAHAYLFWGPEGVGKGTAATSFAQALNCLTPPQDAAPDACGECQSCRRIATGVHTDVRLVTLDTDQQGRRRTEISIDQIRQNPDPRKPRVTPRPLIQDAYLKPTLGRHKVYIVDPADRMSTEAGNALLRVLEDPPLHVVLILVTDSPSGLLPTLLSRCQQVAFQRAGTAAVEERLAAMGVEPEVAQSVAGLSGGRIGWAIRAARQPQILATRNALLDLCADLGHQGVPGGLRMAEEIKLLAGELAAASAEAAAEEDDEGAAAGREQAAGDRALRAQLPWCLDVMASWYRDELAAVHGAPFLNSDYGDALQKASEGSGGAEAEAAIEAILTTKQWIQRNANIDLALESLAIALLAGAG